MAKKDGAVSSSGLKLNYKRTFIIGFAFFGILLLWQVYDSWCPTFLTELFRNAFSTSNEREVQYLVGIMMALDNLAALIMLPIFGKLSDKTHTKIGKRMPYILVGTFVCAVAFPFIPLLFHLNNVGGVIALMAVVVFFAMMYRNPAVALMPDMTPKPLRSKANGIINIMGYLGGAFATVVGIFFVLSQYLGTEKASDGTPKPHTWQYGNIWAIEIPFIVASVLMVVSALFLFIKIRENEIAEEVKEDMAKGEEMSETVDKVEEDKPMTKGNLRMLIFILVAEFFWFMADNGIATFMTNYAIYYLGTSTASSMINTIVGGVGSVIGFAIGGIIAAKIGRKWTVVGGLVLTVLAYVLWALLTFTTNIQGSGQFPFWIYIIWFVKGFGMSLVHVNSFPMVVELCPSKKIGAFTGYYYASSMAAQTITPMLLGLLLLNENFGWQFLPIYALVCAGIALVVFLFLKNVKVGKAGTKIGLEAFDQDD
ncbi:MAG: MFS transporter [Bacilli bacterium]|nr:MFS transporter [Bacilli bacterium]